MERFGKVHFVAGPRDGRYPCCNSIFVDGDLKAVIDPGSDENELRALADRRPGVVIASHYHEDHRTFLDFFRASELYAHVSELPCYMSLNSLLDYYGLLGQKHEQAWRDILLERFNYSARAVDKFINDGEVIDFGGTRMSVIHTPGHSPGHCCFHFPAEGVLFLGDLDMTSFGPWYGDRVSDIDQTIESVNKIMQLDAGVFISSHTQVMKGDISGLARAYLEVIERREEGLLRYLREPRTMDEITGQWICYGKPRDPEYFFEFGERALMKKHLERLEKHGRATLQDDGRYRLV